MPYIPICVFLYGHLVFRGVVDAVFEGRVVEEIQLIAAVRPRDEFDLAVLLVEWEVLDVQHAVGFDEGRVEPQYQAVRIHDRVRYHVIVELLTSAAHGNIPDHAYQTIHTRPCISNHTYQTIHTKPYILNHTYQTIHTKPYIPNHAYQTMHTKPCIPNHTYQTIHTKPYIPNHTYQHAYQNSRLRVPISYSFRIVCFFVRSFARSLARSFVRSFIR